MAPIVLPSELPDSIKHANFWTPLLKKVMPKKELVALTHFKYQSNSTTNEHPTVDSRGIYGLPRACLNYG